MQQRILLVEDSEEYQKIVLRTLGHYDIQVADSAEVASALVRNSTFDLILLDLHLPVRNGFSLLSELQSDPLTENVPIICITGKSEVTDKVTAFSLGAEDYVSKPFDPIELRARVDAKLSRRRRNREKSNLLVVGNVEIDNVAHHVRVKGDNGLKDVPLTQTEFKLLFCLAKKTGQVFTRDQLLVAAWGEGARVLERVVDVHVCSLRKKLKDATFKIRSVQGLGYKLDKPSTQRAVA